MKQFSLKTSILEKVSKILPIVTVLLVPIFFLTTTTEFFSFNKLALITLVVILLVVLWSLKTIFGEKLELVKSSMDRPILALLAILLLSTIFSVNKTDSIWGVQGRSLGLFAFLIIVGYFYLSTPAFKDKTTIKSALYALLISSVVSSIVSTLSYYKIFLGGATFLRLQNFSLTGSVHDAVILSVLAVVISLMLSIYEDFAPTKIALFVITIINFYFVAITGTLLGWALLALGIGSIVFFMDKELLLSKKFDLIAALAIMAVILATTLVPTTRSILIDKNYITESTLPTKESWFVATSTIQDYPILATGPSTFHLNFTRYKPLSMNNTNMWNIRFDKPYNELFNILSTIGIVGLAAAVFFATKLLKFAYATKQEKENSGVASIASVLTVILLASFLFTYATVLSTFLLFFALRILVGAHTLAGAQSKYVKPIIFETVTLSSIAPDEKAIITSQYTKYVLSIPAFLLAGYLGYLSFKSYAGEYFMRKSLIAILNNDSNGAYNSQILAIKYNPKRDTYYDSFARTNLILANSLASKANLTDADKQTIQTLVTQAISNSRTASEVMSPLNVANWETRALIYKNLINTAQNASDWAISSYNTAIQLDPTNPSLRLDLGGVYFAKGDYLSAANQFRQATALKQDYANAHFNFALALEKLKEYDQAKKELDITKLLVPSDSDDAKIVDKAIADLLAVAQPTVAGTSTEKKPTVEELTGVEENIAQEPLSDQTEQPQPGQNLNNQVFPQETPKQ